MALAVTLRPLLLCLSNTTQRYKDATYELPGPASTEEGAESVKQTAAKIIAYFQANNYKIKEAGETIT